MKPLLFGAGCALVALAACAHEPPTPTSTTTTTSATFGVPMDNAISNIASARCNRETACDHVGPGKHYNSYEMCTRLLAQDTRLSVRGTRCPNGVRDSALSSCLIDIDKQACGLALASIDPIASCNESNLCR